MSNKNFYIVIVILAAVTAIGFMNYLPVRFNAAAEVRVEKFPAL